MVLQCALLVMCSARLLTRCSFANSPPVCSVSAWSRVQEELASRSNGNEGKPGIPVCQSEGQWGVRSALIVTNPSRLNLRTQSSHRGYLVRDVGGGGRGGGCSGPGSNGCSQLVRVPPIPSDKTGQ